MLLLDYSATGLTRNRIGLSGVLRDAVLLRG